LAKVRKGWTVSCPGSAGPRRSFCGSSSADHQRIGLGNGPGSVWGHASGRHGHADQQHPGQRPHRGIRRTRTVRIPHRPSGHLLDESHASGLQITRADDRRRQRERPAGAGCARDGSRRADRGSERHEPRDRSAIDERRAIVHARSRGAQEHGQQPSLPAFCRRTPAARS